MQTSLAFDALTALFHENNMKCTKDPNIKIATPEEANEWYKSLYWGENESK